MLKKLLFITLSAILLGGCNLTNVFKINNAARDEQPPSSAPSSPAPDPALESIPPATDSSDLSGLEADINATVILDEDFSDLN